MIVRATMLAIVLATLLISTGVIASTDVLVDDDFTCQADVDVYNAAHGTSYIWGYDAFATIQEGIDAVTGSTVNVLAGTYIEQVTIDKSLSLLGAGESVTTVQLPAAPRAGSVTEGINTWDYIIAAYPSAGTIDVRIEGFTVDANGESKNSGTDRLAGVFFRDVDGIDAGLFSSTIQNFGTTEFESWGVWVCGASDLTLEDNTLSGYTRDGIVANGDDGPGTDPNVVISNNDLTGSAVPLNGIQIGRGAAGTISGNTVRDHTRSSPWAAVGILVHASDGITVNGGNTIENCFYGIQLLQSDGSMVSGNTLTDNVAFHIGLDESDNNQISNNTITGTTAGTEDKVIGICNGATGNTIGGPSPADGNSITLATSGTGLLYGIYVQSTVGTGSNKIQHNTISGGTRAIQVDGGNTGLTTISDNTISDCSFAAVYINAGDAVISGNTLTNTVRPVEFWGAHDVTLLENIMDGSTCCEGINCGSFSGTVTISGNAIYNMLGLAINNRTTTLIDASGNWLDENTPAGVAAEVSDYVDYTPWLNDGTDTEPGTPGFQGDFSSLWVDDDSPQSGSSGLIQEGVDLVTGSTVNVAAGTYDGPVNIEGRDNVAIVGENQTSTIYSPTSTLGWNVLSYGESRQTAIRVVDASNIAFQNMTMDFDLVKGNDVSGLLYWNSGGEISGNVIQNMNVSDASGGYRELTCYLRAPDFTAVDRAQIDILNNTFLKTGRLGVVAHDFVNVLIEGNEFDKVEEDFGYAIELGSMATGIIRDNVFLRYCTWAATDFSTTSAIYVENCFTSSIVDPLEKPVLIEDNDISLCQYGVYVGNEHEGYAGDVDINITIKNNNIHDATTSGSWSSGGILLVDEGKSLGSSVTATLDSNNIENNANYGIYIYTSGNGDISATLTENQIRGHIVGINVANYGSPAGSSYNLAIHHNIFDNPTNALNTAAPGFWDDGISIGNCWSDFESNSGFPTQYNIPGSAAAVDRYPNKNCPSCCIGITGNVDGDPEELIDIEDLTKLIDYLFISFTEPECMAEANCDGSPDGIVDIEDLTRMIDYLFITFTPLADCP